MRPAKLSFAVPSAMNDSHALLSAKRIRVIGAHSLAAFDIILQDDGSLVIRGVDDLKIRGKLTSSSLSIEPDVSNKVVIRRLPWGAR